MLCAWLIPITDNYVIVIVYMWILLFIGAIILPICTGVCLTKVEPEMRPRANSLANLSYNLLGYFPAPSVYGLAVYLHGKPNSGWGMGSLMYASTLMPILIFLACMSDPNLNVSNMFRMLKDQHPKEIQVEGQKNSKELEADKEQEQAHAQELQ